MEEDLKDWFHYYIYDGNTEKINELLGSVQHLDKYVMNKRCESAVAAALKNKRLDIYELLIKYQLRLTPQENFSNIINNVPMTVDERDDYEERLWKIHQKYAKNLNVSYLDKLIMKCKSSHDGDHELRKYREFVSQVFEELNEVETIVPILKLVSQDEKLEIFFDFNQISIEVLVPWTDCYTKGIVDYNGGKVFIGAKDCWEDKRKSILNGVVGHELCHYAMHLTYENDYGKPYQIMNSREEEEFKKVLENSKVFSSSENIIELVFNYEKSHWEKELIVRVPHLLAHYKKMPDKVEWIRSTFKPLFNFYDNVLQDVKEKYTEMESENKVKSLNRKFELFENLKNSESKLSKCVIRKEINYLHNQNEEQFIVSEFSLFTIQAIYQQIRNDPSLTSRFIFLNHKSIKNQEVVFQLKEALNSKVNPRLIIDCSELKLDEKSKLQDLFKDSKSRRIVYVYESDDQVDQNVSHLWNHLTEETQMFLMSETIIFQGESVMLEEILPLESFALQDIPLKELLNGKMRIGCKIHGCDDEKLGKLSIKRCFYPKKDAKSKFFEEDIWADEVIDEAESSRIFVLSNEAGMGKTTEFKLMAKRIKAVHPEYWVIFIDLKLYVKSYEKDGVVVSTFHTRDEVLNHFVNKIMKIQNFDLKVFSQFFNNGQVVFLMDGFDEISPSYKEFNLKLTKAVKKLTKNQVWISTRPHLERELKSNLELKFVYALLPLNQDEELQLIQILFESKNIKDDQLISKANKVLMILRGYQGSVSNPLILRMIVEVFESSVEVFKSDELNLYLLYRTFIEKAIEEVLAKGSQAQQEVIKRILDSNDIIKHLKIIALKTLLSDRSKDLISSPYFDNLQHVNQEQLVRTGLVTLGDSNEIEFIHRTFAEFLFADFAIEQLCDSKDFNMESAFHIFWQNFNQTQQNKIMTWKFIHSAIERRFQSLPICQSTLEKIYNNFEKLNEEDIEVQQISGEINSWKINFQVFCIILVLKRKHWFDFYIGNGSFTSKLNQRTNLFYHYVKKCSTEDIDELILFAAEYLNDSDILKCILTRDIMCQAMLSQEQNLLMHILRNKQIEKILKNTGFAFCYEDGWERVFIILLSCPHYNRSSQTESRIAVSKYFIDILNFSIEKFGRDRMFALLKISDDFESFSRMKFLYNVDRIEECVRWLKSKLTRPELRELMLCSLNEQKYSTNLNHKILINFDEYFDNDEERKAVLLEETSDNWTAFHNKIVDRNNCDQSSFEFYCETYERLCGKEAIVELLLKNVYLGTSFSNRKEMSILHLALNYLYWSEDDEYMNPLWKYLTRTLDKQSMKKLLEDKNDIDILRNRTVYEIMKQMMKSLSMLIGNREEKKAKWGERAQIIEIYARENFSKEEIAAFGILE